MAEPNIVVEAAGVSRSYEDVDRTLEVLHAVDLAVRAGEFLTILGPSGSGKSTLLNLLGLMDHPSSGEVRLFGEPTSGLDEDSRSRLRNKGVGFVFQFDSLLPEFTVLENATLPGRIAIRLGGAGLKQVEARAMELLEAMGIRKLAGRFPYQLSGGERQRAAIARALVTGPGLLLADEPTGNLDRPNGELICRQLRELSSELGVAVLMVTHNEHAAQFSTKTLHLEDGKLQGS